MINKSNTIGLPILYLIIFAIVYAFNLPMPQDDLLRDIVASYYNYDYNQLYVYAPMLTKYNQYIAFDHLLHFMVQAFGGETTAHLIQIFCFIMFVLPSSLIFINILKKDKNCYLYLTFLLFLLLNDYSLLRITLARPEMIFTDWIMWGLWCKFTHKSFGKCLWLIIGITLIPGYWLAFFYLPAVFVVFDNRWVKIFNSLIFLIATILFWQIYSDNQWFTSIMELKKLNDNRLAIIGENKTIIKLLFTTITSTALIGYLYSFKLRSFALYKLAKKTRFNLIFKFIKSIKNINCNSPTSSAIILLCCYLSINMIRYSSIVTALFCILVAIRLSELKLTLPPISRYITLVFAIFMPMTIDCYRTIPKFVLPAGSIVLATNLTNYFVPFYSPGVKVAPAMEVGANLQDIQKMMKSIDLNGTISCKQLRQYHFDYLVEKNLTTIPSCLKIYQIQKGWRAWKIIND